MSHIYLAWNNATGTADWSATGSDLETAVLVSLFTDAVASPDFVPLDGDPRGWWPTGFGAADVGSSLWELERAKKTDQTLTLGIGSAQQSLQWMIDYGIAATVDVTGEWQGERLALAVVIKQPDGSVARYFFGWAWGGLA